MRTSWKHLWLKHQTKWRFLLVGSWNTIIGYLVFVGLDYLFNLYFSPRYIAYMLAAVLSNMISVTIAYFSHKHLTFKSKTGGVAAFREYLRFYMTYIFISILNLILLPLLVEILKFNPKIAAAIITLLIMVVSYISHNKFSFHQGN